MAVVCVQFRHIGQNLKDLIVMFDVTRNAQGNIYALRAWRFVLYIDPLWDGPDPYSLMAGGLVTSIPSCRHGGGVVARRFWWRLMWAPFGA